MLAHLEPESGFLLRGFSADSRYAYLSNDETGGLLRVLDLERLEFVAQRRGTFHEILSDPSVLGEWQQGCDGCRQAFRRPPGREPASPCTDCLDLSRR